MENKSYESALKRLEEIIDHLENKDLPLEDSLKLFQEGIELYSFCNSKLTEVEGKVMVIMEKNKELVEKPFLADSVEV